MAALTYFGYFLAGGIGNVLYDYGINAVGDTVLPYFPAAAKPYLNSRDVVPMMSFAKGGIAGAMIPLIGDAVGLTRSGVGNLFR